MEISKNSRDIRSAGNNGGYPENYYGIEAFAIVMGLILAGI